MHLSLTILPETFAVCRLSPTERIPVWLSDCSFYALTRTPAELSIVAPQNRVPSGWQCEADWRCLAVAGPLDFALTGILANLSAILAQAKISIFAISTFDTDYLLVKETSLAQAITALRSGGHRIVDS